MSWLLGFSIGWSYDSEQLLWGSPLALATGLVLNQTGGIFVKEKYGLIYRVKGQFQLSTGQCCGGSTSFANFTFTYIIHDSNVSFCVLILRMYSGKMKRLESVLMNLPSSPVWISERHLHSRISLPQGQAFGRFHVISCLISVIKWLRRDTDETSWKKGIYIFPLIQNMWVWRTHESRHCSQNIIKMSLHHERLDTIVTLVVDKDDG
jgi:hypothetical protein